jgi:hypothetical protein
MVWHLRAIGEVYRSTYDLPTTSLGNTKLIGHQHLGVYAQFGKEGRD